MNAVEVGTAAPYSTETGARRQATGRRRSIVAAAAAAAAESATAPRPRTSLTALAAAPSGKKNSKKHTSKQTNKHTSRLYIYR